MKPIITTAIAVLLGGTSASGRNVGVTDVSQWRLFPAKDSSAFEDVNRGSSSAQITHNRLEACNPDEATAELIDALCKQLRKFGCDCSCKQSPTTSASLPSSTSTSSTTTTPPTTSFTSSTKTTTTTTATTTKTTSSASCAIPTCSSQGVKYLRYDNPFKGDYSSDYASFDLEYFDSQTPLETGVTNTIYLKTGADNATFNHAAIKFQTFLYACQSGIYTFTSSSTDDATLMWFGEEKLESPTRRNTDIAQFWYGDNTPKTVQKSIEAGTYYPILILWGNTEGAGFLNLQIFAPDGTELTGSSSEDRDMYLVVEPCTAPKPQPSCRIRKLGSGWFSLIGSMNPTSCKAACEKIPRCLSFSATVVRTNTCYLFDVPAASVQPRPDSDKYPNYYTFDRDCDV
ncbi:hypothetical protein NQ176_g9398 [Zarea fungicola]|uniref:Uncharacterized protein n=1 Tax=Zarea fungicola TaxID=93591 RepID=A0ACC1MLW7_9HYPO|nr:hypothetical protein NQ176_g9398 [Lecanicillium fungicola]